MKVLAGDIGGTNTRLIIVEVTKSKRNIFAEKTYPSNQYISFEQVVTCFLTDFHFNAKIDAAYFSIAGPVISGESKITNLPWTIKEENIKKVFNIPTVNLLNDFKAVALGIPLLDDEDILVIQQGSKLNDKSHPDAAIIGAGTGLGASHRVWINNQYHILPSETGHVSFAPANGLQTKFLAWLQGKNKHVCLESVLSGNGLYTIYQFFLENSQLIESAVVKNAILETDPAEVVTTYALSNEDELCVNALDMFVEIYAAIAGDVTLHYYPVDELYIAGGIAPKIKEKISSQLFLNSFANKGLMENNLKEITIKLILNDKVGLYGALGVSQ